MDVLKSYPNATEEQKKLLVEAEKEWVDTIMAIEQPKPFKWPDNSCNRPYKVASDKFFARIKEIMKDEQ